MTKKKKCFFCENKAEINYKNIKIMEKFTTQYGKIVARYYSGNCLRHQKKLAKNIKLARQMALLPFVK